MHTNQIVKKKFYKYIFFNLQIGLINWIAMHKTVISPLQVMQKRAIPLSNKAVFCLTDPIIRTHRNK